MTDTNFINDAAIILLTELPQQSFDSATNLITTYISNNPDNTLTEQEMADAVTNQEFSAIYGLEFSVSATFTIQLITKLTSGLSTNTAAAAMTNQLTEFLTNHINNSVLPMRVESVGTPTVLTDLTNTGGYTTQAIRQAIATALAGPSKIVDYKTLTLQYVQNIYGVDDTWNVFGEYIEEGNPITIIIKKYTDNAYSTLDGTTTKQYIINISPDTYAVVSGIISD